MRTILTGQFEWGERHALQALETGQRMQLENTEGIFGIQMFTIRREQGRLRELTPIIKLFATQHAANSTWLPGLALIYSDLGLEQETRALFEQLAEHDFGDLAQDALRIGTMAYLSEVCVFLGDTARAALLYPLLLPYAGHTIIMSFTVACYGAASHYLGLLAAMMSVWEEAEKHFQDALEMNARIGAKPYLAHTQYSYATMLMKRNRTGDQARAKGLMDEALAICKELGMISLAEKVEGFLKQR